MNDTTRHTIRMFLRRANREQGNSLHCESLGPGIAYDPGNPTCPMSITRAGARFLKGNPDYSGYEPPRLPRNRHNR